MKLSMYMLEQWFSMDSPVVTIESGERVIVGARLITDTVYEENEYAYVGKMSDFFYHSDSHEVVIIHKKDVIRLTSQDLDEVFNRLLAAFDFYNQIEWKMLMAGYQQQPEQCVISSCEQLLGPVFLLDYGYHVLACSQNYHDVEINKYWDNFSITGYPKTEDILAIRSRQIFKLLKGRPFMQEYVEPSAAPFQYGLISACYNAQGEAVGSLVISSDKKITPFEKDMMEIILEAIRRIQNPLENLKNIGWADAGAESLFLELLKGNSQKNEEGLLRGIRGWTGGENFQLLLIDTSILNNDGAAEIARNEMKGYLSQEDVAVILEKRLFCLCRLGRNQDEFQEKIHKLIKNSAFRIAASLPFQILADCRYYMEQALDALTWIKKGSFVEFKSVALRSIFQKNDPKYKQLARHPLAVMLQIYDQKNKSDLGQTLQLYLENERSIKKVAEALYIHRNTVQYRLDKIRSFYSVDWESPEERLYLLLSLKNDLYA